MREIMRGSAGVLGLLLASCQWITGAHDRRLVSELENAGGTSTAGNASGAGGGNDGGTAGGTGGAAGSSGGLSGTGGTAAGTGGDAGTTGTGGAGGSAGTSSMPTSCAEAAQSFDVTQDADVMIDVDGAGVRPPFLVHCVGMGIDGGSGATEYLVLPRHDGSGFPGSNYSTFGADPELPPFPNSCPCPALTSDFSAVRLRLATLTISSTDRRFATFRSDPSCHQTSSNRCCDGENQGFAQASSCVETAHSYDPVVTSGSANVDLTDTPFHLAFPGELFKDQGSRPGGHIYLSEGYKVTAITAGGGPPLSGGWWPNNDELPLEFDPFADACGTETISRVNCGNTMGPADVVCNAASGCCANHLSGDQPVCSTGPDHCELAGFTAELFCDDKADCPDGKVCCIYDSASRTRSECRTVCTGDERQMCRTCRECGPGKTCKLDRCVEVVPP